MIRSFRGPIIILLSAASAVLLLSRFGLTFWIEHSFSENIGGQIVPILWVNFLFEVAVFVGILFVIKWLIGRDRQDRFDKARIDHLSEVAEMSGGFAHEARNLLHALQTRIELLRKSIADDTKSTERVQKLEDIATDLEQLFTDFLALARPAGDQLEESDVAALVNQVLEFEELELERSGIKVVRELDSSKPQALVDRAKFKRALLNLIVNARHAMSDGGTLWTRVSTQGKQVRIEIEDSGCGIPADCQPRVFQSYFTTKSGGTGLGLAIVRRAIEDFGGEISFSSTDGKGTTFVIILPNVEQQREKLNRIFKELALQKVAG